MKKFVFFTLMSLISWTIYAQTVVEDVTKPLEVESTPGLFTETIKIISGSKKIFVLTNNNQQLEMGDFISLVIQDKIAARAIVAKTHQGQAGIKIIRIHSLAAWSKIHRNFDVQIIRGDDSWFGKKKEEVASASAEPETKIESEDDLFNSKGIDDLGDLNENSLRHIKPDNVVSVMLGTYTAQNIQGDDVGDFANQFSAAWGYQFTDNYFAEFAFSTVLLKDFPSGAGAGGGGASSAGISTRVNTTSIRLKYNLKAPLYSFIMPYIGYRFTEVLSPNAGDPGVPTAEDELKKIDATEKRGFVFGATLLRRLVPGWFLRADLGTDMGFNLGVAIEF